MRGKTVMAVDDDEMILELIRTVVETAGGRFLGANGAEQCLAALGERAQGEQAQAPDLLILDIKMEGQDGMSLLADIRGRFPKLKSKVLFLTAQKSGSLVERADELGCDGFVLKPIDPYRLQARIREAFQPTTLDD